MGGQIVFNPIYHDGFYQCWFDVDSKLELDEAITFTTLQTGVQSIVQIKVETD